jgi:clan AA aspartic protease (TIGR02281 family)
MLHKTWTSVGIWLFIGLLIYTLLHAMTAEGPLLIGASALRDGTLVIERSADGHYYLQGSIDDHPVTFLVDTGASSVAISARLADEIGLERCQPIQARTANGTVNGCLATARVLAFAGYAIERPRIDVLPNLHGPALLGMSVLERFRVEQQDGVMRITPPDRRRD